MAATEPFQLTVQGKAEIAHPAERAVIAISVVSEGANKASVSDEVITTTKHLESILKPLAAKDSDSDSAKEAAPVAHWSKTSLSSTSYAQFARNPFGEQTKTRQYRASVTFDVRFRDFKALGSFGTKVSSLSHVEVQTVDWTLTPQTEKSFHSNLRKEAAKDAVRKANDYCEAFGCVNVRPIELQDGHVAGSMIAISRMGAPGMARDRVMAFGAAADDADEEAEDLAFDPQEIKVTMEVTVKFLADYAR